MSQCYSALSLSLAADGSWGPAATAAAEANKACPSPYTERRLALLRSRQPLQDDRYWDAMSTAIERTKTLRRDRYHPDVSAVYACGSYHAWGSGPWTEFLRLSKSHASWKAEDRQAALNLARGYFARAVFCESDLLGHVELVVPVPPNPARYSDRMMSVPCELASAVEQQLALPQVPFALAWSRDAEDVEMKKLNRRERWEAAERAYVAGKDISDVAGRSVLLVDDVTTSGASFRWCARRLRAAGATDVFAACLSYTEG